MRKINGQILLSVGDLSNHIACHHLTNLNMQLAEGIIQAPQYRDPMLAILQERGMEFEKSYLNSLRERGLTIADPSPDDNEAALKSTIAAMKEGADIIYQANLTNGNYAGRADFLVRVEKPGKLGAWSYEVIDSKLAKETRAGTILQLCLYSQMVENITGVMPEFMHVITPENGSTQHTYRVDDFLAYHRFVQRRFEEAIKKGVKEIDTYPDPVAHCEICRWWQDCDHRRRNDDHLCLVAGLSGSQATEIKKWGVNTLEGLAKLPLPLLQRPGRGAIETYIRAREQARVQLQSRTSKLPVYEFLDIEDEKGFFKLPEPSPDDIFFDFESDPFAGPMGMEYLFGWVDNEGTSSYKRLWSFNPIEEKKAFQDFIDMVNERRHAHPDLHIFHYTPYETAALKRLMGKHATREEELDRLLRAGIFIDLYRVAKEALRAGIENYSLKQLEKVYSFERKLALRDASLQLRTLERLLERNNTQIPIETIEAIEKYNCEDCVSTLELRIWLESLRSQQLENGITISRPLNETGDPSEALSEQQQFIQQLYERIVAGISPDPKEKRDDQQQARWILANLLDWYRCEKKASWWEYFRLRDLPESDLLEEKAALAGLSFTGQRRPEKKSFIDRYEFPVQECEIRQGDDLKQGNGETLGEVIAIDILQCTIDIKKGPKNKDTHPPSVFKHTDVSDKVKEEAIIRIATWVADNGLDVVGSYRAGRDLLLGNSPRTTDQFLGEGSPQQKAVQWVMALDNGILPIQGPPGAGKTYTSAQMIVALIQSGKKIGITALSHKVIKNLLEKAIDVAQKANIPLRCIQKVRTLSTNQHALITETIDNNDVLNALQSSEVNIAAGTAWLWARKDFAEAVDVLFVDEAGQFSLIDALAVSQAAKNVVLLGDPQQLKQPQQGSHPEGTDVSALEHILKDHKTISADRGIFLDVTWRLHPAICSFISQLFYESRLHSRPNLVHQVIDGDTKFVGAGLWFEAVEHEGNQSCSIEEADRITSIINELTKGNVYWTDGENKRRPLTLADIMIIAPYNAQVVTLASRLPPGSHAGTVDKFQGQEAPVVIFSMSTSSPEEAPRGMEFLYSLNRLNVAVSRAKSVCIIVASPKLFEPDCKTPGQMKLANAFCRYLEMAKS